MKKKTYKQKVVGRFAPSPSGRMHLGNLFTAVLSYVSARKQRGEWLLRHEDLDPQRCKREYALQVEEDLKWLGMQWDRVPVYQSKQSVAYQLFFMILTDKGLLYPCFCSRSDVHASAPHGDTYVYSGKCRNLSKGEIEELLKTRQPAYRIKVEDRLSTFVDRNYGEQTVNLARDCGDFIIKRGEDKFAYHLAVVVDDQLSGVTEIVRGMDLLQSTHQQIYLHEKLWPMAKVPSYAHVPLLVDAEGRRLSKRDLATDVGYLREHYTAEEMLGKIAFLSGVTEKEESMTMKELIAEFDWSKVKREDIIV